MSVEVSRRPRLLWLYTTPGLTSEIVVEEARKLGLIVDVKDLGVTLSRKLNEITEPEWLAFRAACLAIADPEQAERSRVAALPVTIRWKGQLHAYQERSGINPRPEVRP
jgi:hypothetical protein